MAIKSNNKQFAARSVHIGLYTDWFSHGCATVDYVMVFGFLLNLLARIGDPLLKGMMRAVRPFPDTRPVGYWIPIFSMRLLRC